MGHSKGRDNFKKRARRRKKAERLALAKQPSREASADRRWRRIGASKLAAHRWKVLGAKSHGAEDPRPGLALDHVRGGGVGIEEKHRTVALRDRDGGGSLTSDGRLNVKYSLPGGPGKY